MMTIFSTISRRTGSFQLAGVGHMSHVTCHISHVTFFFVASAFSYWVESCPRCYSSSSTRPAPTTPALPLIATSKLHIATRVLDQVFVAKCALKARSSLEIAVSHVTVFHCSFVCVLSKNGGMIEGKCQFI